MAELLGRLLRSPQGAIGLAIIALVLIAVLFGPWLAPLDPFAISPLQRYRPPGPVNLLGTDHLGRDLLSRILHGASATVAMAMVATLAGTAAGALSARLPPISAAASTSSRCAPLTPSWRFLAF